MEGKKYKATIVFFSIDALGHINPQLSIVRELQKRAYRVIILTTRPLSIAAKLEKQGFETDYCFKDESNETDQVVKDVEEAQANLRKGLPHSFETTYARDGVVGRYLDDMILTHPKIEEKLKSLAPDLIVCDHVIATPCVTTCAPRWVRWHSSFPSVLFSLFNETVVAGLGLKLDEMTAERKEYTKRIKKPIRDAIREFVKQVGCEDWPSESDLAPCSPWLNFYLGVKEIGFDGVGELSVPSNWVRLEHTIDDEQCEVFQMPECLKEKAGKLVYVSFGTIVSGDTEMLNRLLEILSKSPNRFIVSMGPMHERTRLFPNMWGERFVNQKAVLPKVDLFITHGGHNSIIEAFYYGVAGLIVCPVFADQFDSAQRIEDCGFGIRLNPFDCTEGELLGAIERLSSDGQLARRMEAIGCRLRSVKYHLEAADKLESLLTP